MCVIIINKDNKEISEEIIKKAETYNPDGFGILYLDGEREVRKTMDYSKARDLMAAGRPYIAHYRKTTVGKTNVYQCHPFPVYVGGTPKHNVKQNANTSSWLFMNGTVCSFGGDGNSDTHEIAQRLGKVPKEQWEFVLSFSEARFAVVTEEGDLIQTGNWHERDGVYYSKDNVLPYVRPAGFHYTPPAHNNGAGSYSYSSKPTQTAPVPLSTSKMEYSAAPKSAPPAGDGWYWGGNYWVRPKSAAPTTTTTPSPLGKGPVPWGEKVVSLPSGGTNAVFVISDYEYCDSGRGFKPPGKGWFWDKHGPSEFGLGGTWRRFVEKTETQSKSKPSTLPLIPALDKILQEYGVIAKGLSYRAVSYVQRAAILEAWQDVGEEGVKAYLDYCGYAPNDFGARSYEDDMIDSMEDDIAEDEIGMVDGDDYESYYLPNDDPESAFFTAHDWEDLRVVAVYGTLKKGYGNHRLLEDDDVSYLGTAFTVEKYSMADDQWVPHVVDDDHADAKNIVVELYEIADSYVGDQVLNSLDTLEGHPRHYCRTKIKVNKEGHLVDAWLYFSPRTSYSDDTPRVSEFKPKPTRYSIASTDSDKIYGV